MKFNSFFRLSAVSIFCALALSACTTILKDQNVDLSDLSLDENIIPEASIVSIPMPEPIIERAPVRAESASLWQKGSGGFFGDQHASKVGDILTVLIEIDDEAQLENASSRSRKTGNIVEGPKLFGYESLLGKALPGLTQEDIPTGSIIDLGSRTDSKGDGSIERNEKISLKVAAIVVKKLANDNFIIAGRQEVRVNNELRELRVAGIVRPVDIEMNNSISYEKIAEARISYGGKGQISRMQQPRYGEEMLDIILPY